MNADDRGGRAPVGASTRPEPARIIRADAAGGVASVRAARPPASGGDQERGSDDAATHEVLERGRTRILKRAAASAQQRAREVLDNARVEAEVIHEQARDEAAALAARLLDEAREQAAATIVAAQQHRADLLEAERSKLTRLAVAIAEKIIGAELALSPDRVASVVEQCLREVGQARRVTLRVNGADVAAVERAAPRLGALVDAAAVRVEADEQVARGGCVVETERGEVDGRLESQLAAIERALAGSDDVEQQR